MDANTGRSYNVDQIHPPTDDLLRFLDGGLPRRYAAGVERHLSECAACVAFLERAAFPSPLLTALRRALLATEPTGIGHDPRSESDAGAVGPAHPNG